MWDKTVCHAGAFGATNSHGQPIRKGHRFVGNCPHVLEALSRRLTSEEQKRCVPLQGKETTLSQHYPPDMVTAILKGIQTTVQEMYPLRNLRQVNFTTFFVQDVKAWSSVFEHAAHTFDYTRAKSLTIARSDPLWKIVLELTEWTQLERVQVAMQPTMLRFLTHIPHTHRGAALQYTDGATEVFQEDIGEVRHPRARFRKPVHFAVFFYGYEGGQQPAQARHADGDDRLQDDPQQRREQHLDVEITFPGRTPVPQEVKTIVSRLHRNLGHPRAAELKKILSLNAIKNPSIYEAVERLMCVSCERTRDPFRPNLGAAPTTGFYQFADIIQIDIVYIRDITGRNHMFLGAIDETTHLHSLMILISRQPDEVSKALQLGWIRNFGAPLRIKADPDGSFRGNFESDMDALGCFVDYIPAESHHKIGLIERHNATARAIMERIVDSNAVVGHEKMELAAVATTVAKNACTWSAGRPPFVAAFGRIPRIGMNLISDENGLVVGETRAEVQQLADRLRVEAQQHLAEMSISSTFRRALLRKTAPEPDLDAPVGSILAYWRWTARSGKKRGGFKLGRLLGRDPDHRSLWIQSGTATVRVDPSQCRQARGFEQWCPDANDIKALHNASSNLQKGLFQDESLPAEAAQNEIYDFEEQQIVDEDLVQVAPAEPTQTNTELPLMVQQQPSASTVTADTTAQTDPYLPAINQYNMNISSPTYKHTVIQNQTQQTFGMTPDQSQPAVRVPARKPHRSRTPVREPAPLTDQPKTPPPQDRKTVKQAQQTPRTSIRSRALSALDEEASSSIQPRPSVGQPASSQLGPHTHVQEEIIQLSDGDETPKSIGDAAPSTPPELRHTPAKRSLEQTEQATAGNTEETTSKTSQYRSMITDKVTYHKLQPNTYHLHGYDKIARAPGLKVWARLDFNIDKPACLQTTHVSGPSKSNIQHRRVLDFTHGQVMHDQPYSADQDGRLLNTKANTAATVTELWYTEPETHHTAYAAALTTTANGITLQEDYYDGSEDIYMPSNNNVFFQAYKASAEYEGDGQSDDSDVDFDDMKIGRSMDKKQLQEHNQLTRQQQKALDKELPWQFILEQPPEYIDAFVKSAQAEEQSWMKWNTVKPLTAAEVKEIYDSPDMRKRIIGARAAYRDKNKNVAPLKAKTRVVALGCNDPDLRILCRESATPTRQAEYCLYCIFISGKNKQLLHGRDRWCLWSGDVKTAFLQGVPEARDKPLFMKPPRDGITQLAQTFQAPLYLIQGNVYGLASAPRTWQLHVTKTLIQAGFRQHSLDKMLYYLYTKLPGDSFESLAAVVVVYVDDFMVTYNERYDMKSFRNLFTWGSMQELTLDNPLEFKGKEISLVENGTGFSLKLTQSKFIKAMKSGIVDKKKHKMTDVIDPSDLPEFRSIAGSLQWVAGQTRPDVASTVSLCSKGSNSTYQDLQHMYQAVNFLHETSEEGIVMNATDLNEQSIAVTYADSSWANAAGSASQHGMLILLASPRVIDRIESGTLVDWKSSRSTRVCRSTLAAESSAADTAVDRASFISYILSEIFQNESSFRLSHILRQIQVTDCKSLYDVLCSENPNCEDKRTIVVLRSIQQHVQRCDVFWVPTFLMWADSLTKLSDKLVPTFQATKYWECEI